MSYTVPMNENNNNEQNNDLNSSQGNTIDDLPSFLKATVIRHGNPIFRKLLVLIVALCQIMNLFAWSQITQSVAAGIIMYILFCVSTLAEFFTPPIFSHGFFLEILLLDMKKAEKINTEIKNTIYINLFVVCVIVMPAFIYFFVSPFAQTQMLGSNTFVITVSGTIISYVSGVIINTYGVGTSLLVPMLTPIWEAKVKAYLKRVREILIMENNEINMENGKEKIDYIVNELSNEQIKIDTFASKMSKGLSPYYSSMTVNCTLFVVVSAVFVITPTLGSGARINIIMVFSLMGLMMLYWLYVTLQGLSQPSRIWEETKSKLLSDAKIQQAKINLGWTPEIFNEWIDNHQCKGLKAFGFHVTSAIVRKGFSAFASVLTIAVYFLAREELRGMLS